MRTEELLSISPVKIPAEILAQLNELGDFTLVKLPWCCPAGEHSNHPTCAPQFDDNGLDEWFPTRVRITGGCSNSGWWQIIAVPFPTPLLPPAARELDPPDIANPETWK